MTLRCNLPSLISVGYLWRSSTSEDAIIRVQSTPTPSIVRETLTAQYILTYHQVTQYHGKVCLCFFIVHVFPSLTLRVHETIHTEYVDSEFLYALS
jgi:hypothetical protein